MFGHGRMVTGPASLVKLASAHTRALGSFAISANVTSIICATYQHAADRTSLGVCRGRHPTMGQRRGIHRFGDVLTSSNLDNT